MYSFEFIPPPDTHVCETCGASYASLSNFAKHNRKHIPIKLYPCDVCSKSYALSYDLNLHRCRKHPMKFKCDICEEEFLSRGSLDKHSNVHKSVCKYCGRICANRSTLLDHERSHTGERPYKCKICSKKFSSKSAVMKHIRGHSRMTEGDYKCELCGKCFFTSPTLKSHMTITHR